MKAELVAAISSAIQSKTGIDVSSQISSMVDEELALIQDIVVKSQNSSLSASLGPEVDAVIEKQAVFLSAATKNSRIYHAVKNILKRYYSAWYNLLMAHRYLIYSRSKMAEFYKNNFDVDLPLVDFHKAIERTALGLKKPKQGTAKSPPQSQ